MRQRRAALLRRSTPAELCARDALRNKFGDRGVKCQVILGCYIADLIVLSRCVVVELDGAHHSEQADHDARRTRFLEHCGFRVLRYTNASALASPGTIVSAVDAMPITGRSAANRAISRANFLAPYQGAKKI